MSHLHRDGMEVRVCLPSWCWSQSSILLRMQWSRVPKAFNVGNCSNRKVGFISKFLLRRQKIL